MPVTQAANTAWTRARPPKTPSRTRRPWSWTRTESTSKLWDGNGHKMAAFAVSASNPIVTVLRVVKWTSFEISALDGLSANSQRGTYRDLNPIVTYWRFISKVHVKLCPDLKIAFSVTQCSRYFNSFFKNVSWLLTRPGIDRVEISPVQTHSTKI